MKTVKHKSIQSLTKKETCEHLGIAERSLDIMIARGDIPHYKLSQSKRGGVRILVADIEAYIEKSKLASTPQNVVRLF